MQASPDTKDQFYSHLDSAISSVPKSEAVYILGDFNARVGADHDSWPVPLGHHGIGRINENAQRLLELCSYHNLCVTNTFFANKECHKASWRHPRSKHWHQLDLMLTRRDYLNSTHNTRVFHRADCDTDHSLVISKIKLTPKRLHHSRTKCQAQINTMKTSDPLLVAEFNQCLRESLDGKQVESAAAQWQIVKETLYESALKVFGRKEHNNPDWFEHNFAELYPYIEEKRSALTRYKNHPCLQNHLALKSARKSAQMTARRCANAYWTELADRIQTAADTGNTRAMYEGIKIATGKPTKRTAPLKSKTGNVITDKKEQRLNFDFKISSWNEQIFNGDHSHKCHWMNLRLEQQSDLRTRRFRNDDG